LPDGTLLVGVADGGRFAEICAPTLPAAEATDVLVVRDRPTIAAAYNELFARAASVPDLAALVLVHDDVEIRTSLRPAVDTLAADASVGMIGTVGGIGYRNMRWWDALVPSGRYADTNHGRDYGVKGAGDVDGVDGHVLGFSPWVVRNLRFDEATYDGWDGYDADMSFQVRAAGRRVRVAPFDVFHRCRRHYTPRPGFFAAEDAFVRKWLANAMRLNLGCNDRILPGFVNVDLFPGEGVDVVADLRERWPWEDGSVDHVHAHDFIEHLPDKIHTMNELWRVLRPNGVADVLVPSTAGHGAFQDPTHVSFWNENSFLYYRDGHPARARFGKAYGIEARFDYDPPRILQTDRNVIHVHVILRAVK
jgi:hypothetical protein